jgi:hypothetical protein
MGSPREYAFSLTTQPDGSMPKTQVGDFIPVDENKASL